MKRITVTFTRAEALSLADNIDRERFQYFESMATEAPKGSRERRKWIAEYNRLDRAASKLHQAIYNCGPTYEPIRAADLEEE